MSKQLLSKERQLIYFNGVSFFISVCFSFVVLWWLSSKGVSATILLSVFTALPIAIVSLLLNNKIQNINKIKFYRYSEIVKLLIYLLCLIFYMANLNYMFIIILNIVNALILSFNFSVMMSIINENFNNVKDSTRQVTLISSMVGVSASFIGGLFVENLSTVIILIIFSVVQVVNLIFVMRLKFVNTEEKVTAMPKVSLIDNFKMIHKNKLLFSIVVLIPFVGAVESVFPIFTSLYLNQHHLPAYYYGLFYGTINLSMIVGNFILKYIKINKYHLIKYNFIIQGIGMLIVAIFWINIPFVMVGLIFIGLMSGMAQVTVNLIIQESVPKSQVGMSFSMLRLVSVTLQPLAPFLLLNENYGFIYLLSSIILLSGLINIRLMK